MKRESSDKDLIAMIKRWVPRERVPKRVVVKDTADFFRVDYDDVVFLDDVPYLIRNNEREGRFGLEEEQKFWVKRAIDLITGEIKVIKWVFREAFNAKIGNYVFECVRSPQKEARILELVKGRTDFMQGRTVTDPHGNPLRVLDYIKGSTLSEIVPTLGKDHEDFFFNHFPSLLGEFIEAVKAIAFLHENGEKHGDIRRDHLIKDRTTGKYRWIDFDYNYRHLANRFGYDLFGLGNVLLFIAGRGDVTTHGLLMREPQTLGLLTDDDMNIVFQNRVANLRKVYHYIPEYLNKVLMHFSNSARVYYETTWEFLEDLGEAWERVREVAGAR